MRTHIQFVHGKVNPSLIYSVLLELGLGVAAVALGWFLGVNPREHLVPWWDWKGILKSFALGASVGLGLAICMQVFSLLPIRSLQKLDRMVQSQLKTLLGPMGIPELLLLSLSAGIGEELLFRGLIQGWWLSFYENPTMLEALPGILVSAVCFGFAHPLSKTYIAIATLAGLLFGVLYWSTGDLLACVLAHAIYDAIICVYWKWSESRSHIR
ncbi:MAG: CPBP family intramembrane metalloprotease [Planctomycetes bacterium]|nr:CPBP family intramembrane metalloprotease [Planctomycetota bacterium]